MSEHDCEWWDIWCDYGDVYHIDAANEHGEKFLIAENILGKGTARLMATSKELLAACEAVVEAKEADPDADLYLDRLFIAVDKCADVIRMAKGS